MKDGLSDPAVRRSQVGGYYDAGDAVKFNFPAAFSMTLLSWSVIEYSAKYDAVGELGHVRDIIKWGSDYFLKTFNSTADSIDRVIAQVKFSSQIGCIWSCVLACCHQAIANLNYGGCRWEVLQLHLVRHSPMIIIVG